MSTQTRESTTLTRATVSAGPAPPSRDDQPAHGSRSARRRRFTKHSPAGEVVLAYLDAQAAKLSGLDLAVRRDKPDAVHQMRVTVRRLRSTLQSFTGIIPKAKTEHLRAELKWLGGVLGGARDNEVLADHLHAGLKAVPAELVLGPAQARPSIAKIRGAVLHEVAGGHGPWLEDPAGCAAVTVGHLTATGFTPAA